MKLKANSGKTISLVPNVFFCGRNNLSERIVATISHKRASVFEASINACFDELAVSLLNIFLASVINCDESGLTDDPRKTKRVVHERSEYLEIVKNASKLTTSLMFSSVANGTLLLPCVVNKTKNVYDQWTEAP